MRMPIRPFTIVLAIATMIVAGCQRPKELRVPLDYRPTDRLEVGTFQPPAGVRVSVITVDGRDDRSTIGQNVEKSPAVPVYSGDPPPDAFLRDAVARELANAGVAVESDPHQAGKVVSLRVKRFWTEEGTTYKTSIVTEAQVTDLGGHHLWESQVAGSNEKFGRSLSAENYQEGLSDATVDLVQNLLRSPGFCDALKAAATHAAPATRSRKAEKP